MKIAVVNPLDNEQFRVVDLYNDVKDLKTRKDIIKWNGGKIEGEDVLNDQKIVVLPTDIDINIDDYVSVTFINENKLDPNQFVEIDRFEALEGTTQMLQDVDDFTLQQTVSLEQRSVDLQSMDDFAFQTIFALEQRVNELEQRLQALEGSNV